MKTSNRDRVMTGARLAGRVHFALIEDLAKVQAELALLVSVKNLFGDAALPTNSILRSGRDTLTKATEACKRQEEHLWDRYATLTQTISALEEVLIANDEADMEALAQYLKGRFEADRAKAKAK